MRHAANAEVRVKFVAVDDTIRKEEGSQIPDLSCHVKKLEKEEQIKPNLSRRKKIIKIKAESDEIENRAIIMRIRETKSWLFEKNL